MAEEKPIVKKEHLDGNLFNTTSYVARVLRKGGTNQSAIDAMWERIRRCATYPKAMEILEEYVEFE
jgi:hypothetical protein